MDARKKKGVLTYRNRIYCNLLRPTNLPPGTGEKDSSLKARGSTNSEPMRLPDKSKSLEAK